VSLAAANVSADASQPEQLILVCIDRGGLQICEAELRYQLQRRDDDAEHLLEQLVDLEARGLIESTLCFRLTERGQRALLAGHQSPPRAGTPMPWTVIPQRGARAAAGG
jgi:hypothetical protein